MLPKPNDKKKFQDKGTGVFEHCEEGKKGRKGDLAIGPILRLISYWSTTQLCVCAVLITIQSILK